MIHKLKKMKTIYFIYKQLFNIKSPKNEKKGKIKLYTYIHVQKHVRNLKTRTSFYVKNTCSRNLNTNCFHFKRRFT